MQDVLIFDDPVQGKIRDVIKSCPEQSMTDAGAALWAIYILMPVRSEESSSLPATDIAFNEFWEVVPDLAKDAF